jgi:arsenite methyltransferase
VAQEKWWRAKGGVRVNGRARLIERLARQLAHPRGIGGRAVARLLNRHNAAMIGAAVDAVGVDTGAVVADVGFGGGVGLRLLLDRVGPTGYVHAIDPSSAMVSRARRRFRSQVGTGRLRVHEGSLTAMPLPDSTLDGAITVNTVYFVDDLAAAFGEVARVLRSDGVLVVGIRDPDAMATLPVTAHGFRLRPLAELTEALGAAGLPVTEHRPLGEGKRRHHLLICRR